MNCCCEIVNDCIGLCEGPGGEFNRDPAWEEYCLTLEPVIASMAAKFCEKDEAMQEDIQQIGRIIVRTIDPSRVDRYEDFLNGEITEAKWLDHLGRYVRNAMKYRMLSYLKSYKTGPWTSGRTEYVKEKKSGRYKKVHRGPRFSSLEQLQDDHGMQVDEWGNISWLHPSTDGLDLMVTVVEGK